MRLSEFELDVMAHFSRGGELSAPELFERLGKERGVTYSTVKTIVDRLEQKAAIARTATRGRTILYASAVKQKQVRKRLVRSFVRRLFVRPLFAQLLREEALSDEDLAYLQRLIAEKRKGRQ